MQGDGVSISKLFIVSRKERGR